MEKTDKSAGTASLWGNYAQPKRSFYNRLISNDAASLTGPIVIALLIHLIQFLTTGFSLGIWILNPGMLLTDILIAVYIIFIFYKEENTKIIYIVLGILIFKDYFFPLIGNLVISSNMIAALPNLEGMPSRFFFDIINIIFSGLLWPFWLIYLILKSDSKLSSILRFSWILLWIIIIIFPLAMNVDFYSQARKITISPQQEEIVQGIPQKIKTNTEKFTSTLLDPLGCLLTTSVDITYQQCIDKKHRERICKPKKENPDEYKLCMEGKSTQAVGAVDRDIQPSRIIIKKSESYSDLLYDTNLPMPAVLELTNTREGITVTPSCEFISKKADKKVIAGKDMDQIENFKGKSSIPLLCAPEKSLSEGNWQVRFTINVKNLNTLSRLTRIFISKELTNEDKNKIIHEFFPDRNYKSKSPPELTRINFAIGAPTDYPLINGLYNPIMVASIENTGGGEIVGINSLSIELSDEITPIKDRCSFDYDGKELSKKDIKLNPRQKLNYIGSCSLELTPDAIKEGNDFKRREYSAEISYDYKIERSFDFKIKDLRS